MTQPYDTGGLRPATDAPTAGDVPPATAGAPESPATLLERLLKEVENTPGGNSNSGDNSDRGSSQTPPQADPAASPGSGGNPTGGSAYSPAGGATGSPMNGLMGSLLSHPELLQTIPTLISTLGPMMRTGGSGTPGAGIDGRTGGDAGGRTGGDPGGKPGGGAHPGGGFHPDRHTPLLKAIKPYLGPERRQALEAMIQLCQVWDTLQDLGISLLPPAADNRGTQPPPPSGKEG